MKTINKQNAYLEGQLNSLTRKLLKLKIALAVSLKDGDNGKVRELKHDITVMEEEIDHLRDLFRFKTRS